MKNFFREISLTKIISLILVLCLSFCMMSCGGSGLKNIEENNESVSEATKKPSSTDIEDKDIFYIKEDIFSFNLGGADNPVKLTEKLADAEYRDKAGVDWYSDIGIDITVSKDGSLVFYPDKVDSEHHYDACLYYRNVKDTKKSAVEIDTDVISYFVNDDATIVTYVKGESNDLYQYTIKTDSRQKIATEVIDYELSEDHSKIVFLCIDGSVYFKGKDNTVGVRVANNADSFSYVNANLSEVWYSSENDELYKLTIGKGTESIDSDVYYVVHVYDSGEAYYLKKNAELYSYTLYFFDGNDNNVITEFLKDFDFEYAYDYPLIVYNVSHENKQEVEKMHIAICGKEYSIQQNSVSGFFVNESGNKVYFCDTADKKEQRCLYYITIENGEISSPKIYDENVDGVMEMGNHIVCVKNYNSGVGDLYIDKEKVSADVDVTALAFYKNEDTFIYFTDCEDSGSVEDSGTLNIYTENGSEKIAENVVTFLPIVSNGRVVYLCDYDWNCYSGKLCEWNNGKIRKIDDNVYYILQPFAKDEICH